MAQRQVKLRKLERELGARLGREPTDDELADAAGLPLNDVVELRELTLATTSLDQAVGDEDGETALGDPLASDQAAPIEEAADNERDQLLGEAVGRLPADEQNVIRLRFGLAGKEPRTLRQASSELGITPDRARELEQRGLRRLTGDAALDGLAEAA